MSTALLSPALKRNSELSFERLDDKEISQIWLGIASSPAGDCFVAWTIKDNEPLICFLAFANEKADVTRATKDLQNLWPASNLQQDDKAAAKLIDRIFAQDDLPGRHRLLIKGTVFQEKVWRELILVPAGQVMSYKDLACQISGENFTRSVASAVAKNNISYLIPCHRIISKSGSVNKYRWGKDVKQRLLELEKSSH